MKKIKFSIEAKRAINLIQNTTKSVFVTGKAGTGKSTLLEYIRCKTDSKMVVLAPTGVAAINVHGETIHSFFGLKPGFELNEAKEKRIHKDRAKKYSSLKTVMIDEISMVRADLLDAIDVFLRKARRNNDPFGGVQMVFFGDLYQLPPVVTPADREQFYSHYKAPYFFKADVFSGAIDLFASTFDLEIIELIHVYRQKDEQFIKLLNAVRNNALTSEDLETLNTRYNQDYIPLDSDDYIHLMTTNRDAAAINNAKLFKLTSPEVGFTSTSSGTIARNLFPNDKQVTLKVGAQIMFIYNDPERKWVNGTIGKVVEITDEFNDEESEMQPMLIVEKSNGELVKVRRYTWEISKYVFENGEFKRVQIGSFTQVPLKLAWAITIHKSQGKTFEKVILDLGYGSFAHGQSYVALSRCTSLEGLVLRRPFRQSDIIMDTRIQEFEILK